MTSTIDPVVEMEQPPQILTEYEFFTAWWYYLCMSLFSIVVIHVIGVFLPILAPKIAQYVLPSCRARRRETQTRLAECRELRKKMKQLNMVDNFAAYSKLERRLKALERSQNEAELSNLGTTVSGSRNHLNLYAFSS